MYAGLSPFTAFAIYAVITYMDSIEGVYFPEGGMHAVPRAMATAAEKNGAVFMYSTTVDEGGVPKRESNRRSLADGG